MSVFNKINDNLIVDTFKNVLSVLTDNGALQTFYSST